MICLVVFITGAHRCFWDSWKNLLEKVIRPNRHAYRIIVSTGIDKTTLHHDMIPSFENQLADEWTALGMPDMDLHMDWLDRDDPHLMKAVASITDYTNRDKLGHGWLEYLTKRSGSCIEYAQFATLYEKIIRQYDFTPDDLLLRFRTDVVLRHPMEVHVPDVCNEVADVMHSFFPTSNFFSEGFIPNTGREGPILPRDRVADRWCLTLRKNLIYLMPLLNAKIVVDVCDHYGDWDIVEDNAYWFNAESQFRGCLRIHNFTVFDFCQQKDECFGRFESSEEDFPIYAILRC